MGQGCIHYYYGDGKGKTTAAMGLALRALGQGMPVQIVQFLKDGSSGECGMLKQLGASVTAGKAAPGFVFSMTEAQKKATKALHNDHLDCVSVGNHKLLVLDEAGDAISLGLLDQDQLTDVLDHRGETEIVITGHGPVECLMDRADYITEMKALRHPYTDGLPARAGIEF